MGVYCSLCRLGLYKDLVGASQKKECAPVNNSAAGMLQSYMLIYYYYYYYYYCYKLQLSCRSVAVVLTIVQTKQIRINIHKQNHTKNSKNNN